MSRVYWILHKGKNILSFDYSGLSAEELVETAREFDEKELPKHRKLPENSVLCLSDVSDSIASKQSVAALKRSAKLWRPLIRKQAVVGLTPFQMVFLRAVNRFADRDIVSFKSRDEALDWLAEGE